MREIWELVKCTWHDYNKLGKFFMICMSPALFFIGLAWSYMNFLWWVMEKLDFLFTNKNIKKLDENEAVHE